MMEFFPEFGRNAIDELLMFGEGPDALPVRMDDANRFIYDESQRLQFPDDGFPDGITSETYVVKEYLDVTGTATGYYIQPWRDVWGTYSTPILSYTPSGSTIYDEPQFNTTYTSMWNENIYGTEFDPMTHQGYGTATKSLFYHYTGDDWVLTNEVINDTIWETGFTPGDYVVSTRDTLSNIHY